MILVMSSKLILLFNQLFGIAPPPILLSPFIFFPAIINQANDDPKGPQFDQEQDEINKSKPTF